MGVRITRTYEEEVFIWLCLDCKSYFSIELFLPGMELNMPWNNENKRPHCPTCGSMKCTQMEEWPPTEIATADPIEREQQLVKYSSLHNLPEAVPSSNTINDIELPNTFDIDEDDFLEVTETGEKNDK